jgi:hypothetical protein
VAVAVAASIRRNFQRLSGANMIAASEQKLSRREVGRKRQRTAQAPFLPSLPSLQKLQPEPVQLSRMKLWLCVVRSSRKRQKNDEERR